MEQGVVVGAGSDGRSAPPLMILGLAGVAVVLAFVAIALFPRATDETPPPSGSQSSESADIERWQALYERLTQIRVEAPNELPGGYRLAAIAAWQPLWSSPGTIRSWLLYGPDSSWVFISIEPALPSEQNHDDDLTIPGLDTLRSETGGARMVLEWRAADYGVRIEGAGLTLDELGRLAAGIDLPEDPTAGRIPDLGYLPAGFAGLADDAGTIGPGRAGWRAAFVLPGENITLTAAADRTFPFGELFTLASDNQAKIRKYWGLAFDYPGELGEAAPRSRLLWFEEGAMLEATSTRLDSARLAATVEPLDLRDPEQEAMRTLVSRSRLAWFSQRGLQDDAASRQRAGQLLELIDGSR